MRYVFLIAALIGVAASSLALYEHYRPYGDSPCNINDHWDCGVVNHSPYALIHGLPVAVIGIAGYLLLGGLALFRAYRLMLVLAASALAYALYLANIEAHVLGVWCLYCVISLGTISLITLLLAVLLLIRTVRRYLMASPISTARETEQNPRERA